MCMSVDRTGSHWLENVEWNFTLFVKIILFFSSKCSQDFHQEVNKSLHVIKRANSSFRLHQNNLQPLLNKEPFPTLSIFLMLVYSTLANTLGCSPLHRGVLSVVTCIICGLPLLIWLSICYLFHGWHDLPSPLHILNHQWNILTSVYTLIHSVCFMSFHVIQ